MLDDLAFSDERWQLPRELEGPIGRYELDG